MIYALGFLALFLFLILILFGLKGKQALLRLIQTDRHAGKHEDALAFAKIGMFVFRKDFAFYRYALESYLLLQKQAEAEALAARIASAFPQQAGWAKSALAAPAEPKPATQRNPPHLLQIESLSKHNHVALSVIGDELVADFRSAFNRYRTKFYLKDLNEHFIHMDSFVVHPRKSFQMAAFCIPFYLAASISSSDHFAVDVIKITALAVMAIGLLTGLSRLLFTQSETLIQDHRGRTVLRLDERKFDYETLTQFLADLETKIKAFH